MMFLAKAGGGPQSATTTTALVGLAHERQEHGQRPAKLLTVSRRLIQTLQLNTGGGAAGRALVLPADLAEP